jgi:hypothetical protein
MSQVEVDIPLYIVLEVGSYGTLLVLYLFQILLYLDLHLYIQFDLLMVHCTKALDYTTQGYIVVACYCIAAA